MKRGPVDCIYPILKKWIQQVQAEVTHARQLKEKIGGDCTVYTPTPPWRNRLDEIAEKHPPHVLDMTCSSRTRLFSMDGEIPSMKERLRCITAGKQGDELRRIRKTVTGVHSVKYGEEKDVSMVHVPTQTCTCGRWGGRHVVPCPHALAVMRMHEEVLRYFYPAKITYKGYLDGYTGIDAQLVSFPIIPHDQNARVRWLQSMKPLPFESLENRGSKRGCDMCRAEEQSGVKKARHSVVTDQACSLCQRHHDIR
uniref:SWIM-type domain-containing protein n=3 Tax=Palpitomonas bilix TaxID=652834 RepID=A0A7S3D5Z5_9EUKA|mmetsp:Transcript_21234/g.55233  ORF Transcript_21234/g.55233 Transcript_21234/m.55233 type:complete len:253 (+) Transcript_21234:560-1318(+)